MNGGEVRIYDFEKMCRLCLDEKRNLFEIFESTISNNSISLREKIMSCAAINLHRNDGLPTRICFKCMSNVNAAFEFRIQCEKADKRLRDVNNITVNKINEERSIDISNSDDFIVQSNEEISSNKISSGNVNQILLIKKQKISNSIKQFTNSFFHINNEYVMGEKSKNETFRGTDIYNAQEICLLGKSDSLECLQQNVKKPIEKLANEKSLIIQDATKVSYEIVSDFSKKKEEIKLKEHKIKSREKFKLDRRKAPCPFCNKILMRMDEHIRLLHRNRVYICKKQGCGAEFSTLKNLQSHQLRCYDVKKAYKCYKCAKEFHRNSNFKAHIRRHSNKKDYQCQLCDKAFVDSTGLRRHFLKHHEPEQQIFVSGCCGKKFKSKEGLKKHINKSICGLQIFELIDSGFATNLSH